MDINFFLIAKVTLIVYMWILIVFYIIFLLKSQRIYKKLKDLERQSIKNRREVIHKLIPTVLYINKYNSSFQTMLNLNLKSPKDIGFLTSNLFKSFSFYQSLRYRINIIKSILFVIFNPA